MDGGDAAYALLDEMQATIEAAVIKCLISQNLFGNPWKACVKQPIGC